MSIAHRYEFLNVRERAISEIYGPFRARQTGWDEILMGTWDEREIQQELEQHEHQLLISLAEKYDVPLCHIVPLLLPFVMRKQPLTVEEVLRFSALTLTRLANAREDFQREKRLRNGLRMKRMDTEEIVHRIWQPPVEALSRYLDYHEGWI
jgi:hypothetical protein